eukprot:TRINITY_DN2407_c0_g2_i1.p1 TRINITY_DN2407_c0_g2~~TRINITY_DN2407_c0_g2_i1.p1  ORF type:complete len:748 (+),score=248.08 TRINITY_DN2407_c0_g2_i1:140-2383(+)
MDDKQQQQQQQASKKPTITIKAFRSQVPMDPNYADKTWKLLKNAICEIHKQNASGLSFEELYRNAYNMVLHKYGERLYKGLTEVVEEHLRAVGEQVATAVDDTFLQALNKAWADHKVSMLMIRDILMYMDRVYVLHQNLPPVYDLGLQLFRDNIARALHTKDRIRASMLSIIQKERAGELVDRSLLKSVTQMLVELGVNNRTVYEKDFERPFLESSAAFYRVESQDFITCNSCPDYMKKVEQRMKEEMERVAQYLDSSTESKIKEVLETELITNHLKTLLEMENSGLVPMLRDDKIEDLCRMYALVGRVPNGLQSMRELLVGHVAATCRALVTDEDKQARPCEWVQALLDFRDKYERLLDDAFARDRTFAQALNQTFEQCVNLTQRAPEFISLFIDDKLKRGLKGVTDEEVDTLLDKVVILFRFLQEKDVFEKYYKQHLAKRLLLGRSVSDDAERAMISKLKTECGFQFTSKLEGMFQDMKVSADTMDGYKSWISQDAGSAPTVDLAVQVLTTGFWPTQSTQCCQLPTELLTACELFERYYMANRNGRKLTWQANMGNADVKAVLGSKKHELSVSTFQMVVLLHFNDTTKLTFHELQENLKISIPDLKRALFALTCGKAKILAKQPPGEKPDQFKETDIFFVNPKFKSKLYRVKVVALVQKETVEESAETRQKVDEDRKALIEAAIVRTMKARKTMTHSLLVAEVIRQLSPRFVPNPNIIKKRIESLLEREYLERSKEDRAVYNYLA